MVTQGNFSTQSPIKKSGFSYFNAIFRDLEGHYISVQSTGFLKHENKLIQLNDSNVKTVFLKSKYYKVNILGIGTQLHHQIYFMGVLSKSKMFRSCSLLGPTGRYCRANMQLVRFLSQRSLPKVPPACPKSV